MARDFQITQKQRDYLRMALDSTLYTGDFSEIDVIRSMVKRGWLRKSPRYTHLYEITELGRMVARQLGITAKDVQP